MTVKIMGIEFPMAYTVEAEMTLEEKFEGAMDRRKIEEIFDTTVYEKLVDNISFVTATLVDAGKRRENIRDKIMGRELKNLPCITYEELKKVIQPGEVIMLMRSCIMTINQGNKINVEVAPEKGKKKDGTKSK